MTDPIVILSAKRTPMGGLGGELSAMTAAELGAVAAKSAVAEAGVAPGDIDEVIFGNVLSAGQGQAPARQVALGAGLSVDAVSTTINKMCGSGMKAAMMAHDFLRVGSANMVLAGGTESMSNAPYLLPKVRDGLRFLGESGFRQEVWAFVYRRDLIEERLHVAQRGDGHAAAADLTDRVRVVGVVAHDRHVAARIHLDRQPGQRGGELQRGIVRQAGHGVIAGARCFPGDS